MGLWLRDATLGVLLFSLGAILVAIRAYLSTGNKAVAGRRSSSPPSPQEQKLSCTSWGGGNRAQNREKRLLHGEGGSFGSQSPTGAVAR